MVAINTSYYCPRITSMHTTPSVSLQGKRITKPRASIPPCWWGSSNHPNPMPEGILTTIKPTGHLFFFSLRPFQPGFCVCSAFPRKGHYVSNKHPSAILLHVCGIIVSVIWLTTDRCSLASAGLYSTHPGNPVAWYSCPHVIPSPWMWAELGTHLGQAERRKSGLSLKLDCHKDAGFSLTYRLLFSFLWQWKSVTNFGGTW